MGHEVFTKLRFGSRSKKFWNCCYTDNDDDIFPEILIFVVQLTQT